MFVIVNEFILVCVCSSYTTGGKEVKVLRHAPFKISHMAYYC